MYEVQEKLYFSTKLFEICEHDYIQTVLTSLELIYFAKGKKEKQISNPCN